MRALRSIALAFSMFSKVPMPRIPWAEDNMRYMLAAFPLVGLFIGLCARGWAWFAQALSLGNALTAFGLTAASVLLSGGIHLDGFCDTIDALASCAPPEKKREILKDPHIGAFAAIGVCLYLLFYFALCMELEKTNAAMWIYALIPFISRACSGFVGVFSSLSKGDGLLSTFHSAAAKKKSAYILAFLFFAGAFTVGAIRAWSILVPFTGALSALLVWKMANRRFGGMSGDLAGYLLQVAEISMLLNHILLQKAVEI